jgi:tRNA nucleotidyltransferase/poly(A) polymerase
LNTINHFINKPQIKIYKVGGCVRDIFLRKYLNISLANNDQDFVVVGASRQDMIAAGFIPVAKHFPVFLDPIYKAEYALARTEKSTGKAYTAFNFQIENISLEEDLSRRDITINAIAQTLNGEIIDPFNGIEDIKNRIIRHISQAFIEDPLRILRVARFANILNFTVAATTLELMTQMADDAMLFFLPHERIWAEIKKTSKSTNIKVFIEILAKTKNLQFIFPNLNQNFDILYKYLPDMQHYQSLIEQLSFIMILDIIIIKDHKPKELLQYFPFLTQRKIISCLTIINFFFNLLIKPINLNKDNFNQIFSLAEKIYKQDGNEILTILIKTNKYIVFDAKMLSIKLLNILQHIYKDFKKYCFKNLTNSDIIQIKYRVVEKNYCDFYLTVK